MEVKHYGQAEAAGIRELLLDLHDSEYAGSDDSFHSRDRFAQFVDSWSGKEGFACVVGYDGQEPVGFAYGAPFAAGRWWRGSDLPVGCAGPSFALSELMVLPRWRKTGASNRLHDALVGARTEARATLLVDVLHPRVQALYERWGYEKFGEQQPFADSPVFAVMVKPLDRLEARGARVFREAWIAGVRRHFPGEPKPGYVTPWEETPEWERQAAGAVYAQVQQFLEVSGGQAGRLTREQKGRFVATCWAAQMYRHFGEPKPAYVADWPELPEWQQETDADIFEAIAGAGA